jgi:hypothetical protein
MTQTKPTPEELVENVYNNWKNSSDVPKLSLLLRMIAFEIQCERDRIRSETIDQCAKICDENKSFYRECWGSITDNQDDRRGYMHAEWAASEQAKAIRKLGEIK